MHWITTATVLALVLGAPVLIQPAGAAAQPPVGGPTAEPAEPAPGAGPDPQKAAYPADCGPDEAAVIDQGAGDLDGDGRQETVAVVSCAVGFGTRPSGIYVLAYPADRKEAPRIVETLLDPEEGLNVSDFAVRGRTVSATLLGYSSQEVPRCCPDRERKVDWQWRDGIFRLTPQPVPGSV